MNALSRAALRNRLERVIGVVVVLSMVAAGVSGALASGLPGVAGNQLGLAQDYAASECEAQLAQAASDRQSAAAPLAGLALVRSEASHYDLWRPAGWNVFVADQATLILAPGGQKQGARFTIRATDTGDVVTGYNLQSRVEWFNTLVHAVPNSQVEWQSLWFSGNVTGFEARYTYRDDDIGTETTHWVRLLYVGTKQYWLDAEAPSAAEFDRLQLMFVAMMFTFRPDDRVQQYAADMCLT